MNKPNAELNSVAGLEFLVGEWRNTGQVPQGAFGPGGLVEGKTIFHWGVGNEWLLYLSRLVLPGLGEYEVQGGFNFKPRTARYQAYAINSLGNMMIYDGEWVDEHTLVFTLINPGKEGSGRVMYIKQPQGSVIMRSERSTENGDFAVYFETIMKRDM